MQVTPESSTLSCKYLLQTAELPWHYRLWIKSGPKIDKKWAKGKTIEWSSFPGERTPGGWTIKAD
jgi:hypothetical protein